MGGLPFSASMLEGLGRPIWERFGTPLGALWGPSWAPLGPTWGYLGPSWAILGPSWGHLGAVLGHLGAILGPSWPSWGHCGAIASIDPQCGPAECAKRLNPATPRSAVIRRGKGLIRSFQRRLCKSRGAAHSAGPGRVARTSRPLGAQDGPQTAPRRLKFGQVASKSGPRWAKMAR